MKKTYLRPEVECIKIGYNHILCLSKLDKFSSQSQEEEDDEVENVEDLL